MILKHTWLTTSTQMTLPKSIPLPGMPRGCSRGSSALLATSPGCYEASRQSFLGSRCYTLFLGRLEVIILFRRLFLVKCEFGNSGGSSQIRTNMAMKQFPLGGEKKRLIRLTKGSAYAFSSNWQKQDMSCCVQWAASWFLLSASQLNPSVWERSRREHCEPNTESHRLPLKSLAGFSNPKRQNDTPGVPC